MIGGRHAVRELHWAVGDHCALEIPSHHTAVMGGSGVEATEEKTSTPSRLLCDAAFATLHTHWPVPPPGRLALGVRGTTQLAANPL